MAKRLEWELGKLFYEQPTLSILKLEEEIVRTSVSVEGGAEGNEEWFD